MSAIGKLRFQSFEPVPLLPFADDFADAILLVGASGSYGPGHITDDFTTEEGEPEGSALTNGIHETVWFRWVAPADGEVSFNTHFSYYTPVDDGEILDTTLAVWTGTDLGDLVEVASNDDDPSGDWEFSSLVTFEAVESTTYWIQVGTYDDGIDGQITLNWTMAGVVGGGGGSGVTSERRFNRIASNYSDTHAADNAERYAITTMQGFNGPLYNAAIHAADGKALIYKDAIMLGTVPGRLGSSLNANYAVQNGEGPSSWDLGRAWNHARMGDIGDPTFQAKWAANAIAAATAPGEDFDGVFIDDALWKLGSYPAKYPNVSTWRAAMRSFLAYVGPTLQDAGLLVIANIGSASDTDFLSTLPDWLSLVNGYMEEGLARHTTDHDDPVDTGVRVDNQLANIATAQSLGKNYVGVVPADDDDLDAITYGFVMFLLETDGSGLATVSAAGDREEDDAHYGHEVYTSVHDDVLALGEPTGPRVGYTRDFDNGSVSLDPDAGTAEITLI